MVFPNNIFLLISVVILVKKQEKLWFKIHKALSGLIYALLTELNLLGTIMLIQVQTQYPTQIQ